jgi:hypothetical protein
MIACGFCKYSVSGQKVYVCVVASYRIVLGKRSASGSTIEGFMWQSFVVEAIHGLRAY